ncbi:MAG TPA: methyltransferase domain-containing protein [Myxococcales bacterium]|nr:methyltransferase domain-containing protein [Myxococcales bacterium]
MKQPAPEKFLRVEMMLPDGWEETVSFLLQEEGWGGVISERSYPGGILAGEDDSVAGVSCLVVLLQLEHREAFSQRIQELADSFGWSKADWSLAMEERLGEDWEEMWRSRWKPFRCGGFVVHADFHALDDLKLRADDCPLCMVAGSAFGTGGHASTRMALRTLQTWWTEKPFNSLLDVGTGSGILAVAAAMLGAKKVMGMDPDPASAAQATATANTNRVGESCKFWRGTGESASGQWDVVMANLQSDILVRDAALLAGLVEPGGRLFGGGILDFKADLTIIALEQQGLKMTRKSGRGRWVTIEFSKCK